ncbi:hypothetical protein B0H16DRAFT_1769148 [Mycena metata]|uniref:Uncharacterized protein n=1 Tax=Mycena metata TaxID=1033252 RepID=A0AAD7NS38_9AGAR|nr:hypothetical protein B0H16DRAFT_1769148 [Mycena metata]
MRALLHRDLTERKYRESPRLLDPDRLSFTRQNAQAHPSHPLVIVMNYTDGHPATMWVADAYWEREEDLEQQARWDRHIDRVARSAGRIELHVIVIQDGRRARRLIFPQRSEGRSFYAGLLEVGETRRVQQAPGDSKVVGLERERAENSLGLHLQIQSTISIGNCERIKIHRR